MDGRYKIVDNELLIMICCPKDSFFGGEGRGLHSLLAAYPAALGSILDVPNNFCLDVTEIY